MRSMSYEVLARKYRSKGFDDVVGQDHVAGTLKRAIESGRIASAYLLCGTRGVGKTSMARILAKALNCQKRDEPTSNPCGKCDLCQAIARGDDLDVIEIDAASNTGVDNVRELIENSQYRPARSRFKVYIIDEAHMLSKPSFNALLKTLEEPPEHVKFILATTEPEKLLPTILSRCQRYDFRNIPTREIAEHLQRICTKEEIKADDDALVLIAKSGAGSMRDALSLLDRLLSVGQKNLTTEMIEQMLGMPKSQVVFDLVQSIGEGNVKQVLETADALVTGGLSPDTLVASLADHLRNLLIIRTCGAKSKLVEVPGLEIDELDKQAQQFDAVTLSQDIALLEELRRSMRSTQSGRALFDATLVRLALAEQFAAVSALLGQIECNGAAPAGSALKKNAEVSAPRSAGHKIPPAAPAAESERSATLSAANIEPVSITDLPAVWQAMLGVLSSRGASFLPLVESATLASIDDNVAVLRYPSDCDTLVKMLDRNGKKDAIRDALSSILKCNVGVKLEVLPPPMPSELDGAQSPRPARRTATPVQEPAHRAPPTPEPPARITAELRAELRKNPLIGAVLDQLGGEIVKVE